MRRRLIPLTAALVLASGCTRADPYPDAGMTTEQFVEVIVALRRAAQETDEAAAFEARRQQVLRDAAVTDSMLLDFVRVRGHDVAAMNAVWDSVAARLRQPQLSEDVR